MLPTRKADLSSLVFIRYGAPQYGILARFTYFVLINNRFLILLKLHLDTALHSTAKGASSIPSRLSPIPRRAKKIRLFILGSFDLVVYEQKLYTDPMGGPPSLFPFRPSGLGWVGSGQVRSDEGCQ